jgi:hypothetical protein
VFVEEQNSEDIALCRIISKMLDSWDSVVLDKNGFVRNFFPTHFFAQELKKKFKSKRKNYCGVARRPSFIHGSWLI